MSLVLKQQGHLDEYHWSSNIPPRPLEPLASMYMSNKLQGDSRICMPFQDGVNTDHHHKSEHTYVGTCLLMKLLLKVIENLINPLINMRPWGITCVQNCKKPMSSCRSLRLQRLHDCQSKRYAQR